MNDEAAEVTPEMRVQVTSEVAPFQQRSAETNHQNKLDRIERARQALALPPVEECGKWPRDKRQATAARLMVAHGLSLHEAAEALGIRAATLHDWFHFETEEMQRFMKLAVSGDATQTLAKAWKALKGLLKSTNAETVRKASMDLMRAAGMGIDAGGGQTAVTINVKGDNTKLTVLSVSDIEAEMKRLAAEVDPAAAKLVDAEIVSVRTSADGASRASGSGAGESGREAAAPAGPDGGVPPAEGGAAP